MQLLDAVGAFPKKKSSPTNTISQDNYQASVTEPLHSEADDLLASVVDIPLDDTEMDNAPEHILAAVDKVYLPLTI
jgi:hypothetical protein